VTDAPATSAVVRRVLPASPEVAYDEWLDEDALAEFMCPYPVRATKVEIEPRIGGRFFVEMTEGEHATAISGEYLELDRPHRLSFSWSYAPGVDSVVTITFEARGQGQTLMTIDHTKLPPEDVESHTGGWSSIAELLERKLAAV
jgi:uncharacterized protein YndB with AHSA1/START domain